MVRSRLDDEADNDGRVHTRAVVSAAGRSPPVLLPADWLCQENPSTGRPRMIRRTTKGEGGPTGQPRKWPRRSKRCPCLSTAQRAAAPIGAGTEAAGTATGRSEQCVRSVRPSGRPPRRRRGSEDVAGP
jgi:hypothetical protein